MKRWVVRTGDGTTVGEILARAGIDARAVEQGRVFVGKKRVKSAGERVSAGDELRFGEEETRDRVQGVVVLQRDGLVAAIKTSGIPTVADHAGTAHAFVAVVAKEIRTKVEDLRVTSRLDREVSGVIVFATSTEAESALKDARARGEYVRTYVAIAANAAALPEAGSWNGAIGDGKDARHRSVGGKNAKESETRFRVVARVGTFALLAVEPITGRTHQIRVHSAHAGAPLFGDRDYGGPTRATLENGSVVALARIALHAARVKIRTQSGVFAVDAPIPDQLTRLWADLGGDPAAWNMVFTAP